MSGSENLNIDTLHMDRMSELAEFVDVSATNAEDIFRKLEKAGDGFLPESQEDTISGRSSKIAAALAGEVEKVYRRELGKLTMCASTLDRWRRESPTAPQASEIERIGWELTQLQRKYMKIIEMAARLSSATI